MKTQEHKSFAPALAYSYVRFSTPEQAKGDSLRRQTEAAADWCKRNGVTLDTSTTLHDLGRSAFLGDHRKNPDRNALAAFLKLVEQGKVPRGSFLLLESLDRLSREHIRPALTLLLQLIEAGVRVVQLIPVEAIYDDKVEPMSLMMAIMELSRGHSESAVKSERVGAAWADKKSRARAGDHIVTHRLPAWIEWAGGEVVNKRRAGGELVLIPAAAKAVRRVFELTAAGYGHHATAKRLKEEGVPAIGRTGEWNRAYIALVLRDRRAVGEYRPRDRDHRPDGDPIPNYYPAVVTEEEWLAARTGAAGRRQPGRKKAPPNGSVNNLFAGLLTAARDGGSCHAVQRFDNAGKMNWVLLNSRSTDGRVPCVSFPLEPFERAVLSRLREIDPRDFLADDAAPVNTAVLAAELARADEEIASLERELESAGETIPAVVRVLAKKEARRKVVAEELAEARAKEATPVGAAWGEFGSLWDMLEGAADRAHARRRLRSVLRRMVECVYLLAVPRGRTRLAAVRVQFLGCGDRHRDYLISYSPPKANQQVRTAARLATLSFASAGLTGELDLRNAEHVRRLEAAMRELAV